MVTVLRLFLLIALPALLANNSSWSDQFYNVHYYQNSGAINNLDSVDLPSYITTGFESNETENTALTLLHHSVLDLLGVNYTSRLKITTIWQSLSYQILSYLSLLSHSPPA
jgi:hypothetical protein